MRLFKRIKRKPQTRLSKITCKTTGALIGTQIVTVNLKREKRLPDLVYCTFTFNGSPMPTSEEMDRFDAIQDRLDHLAEKLDFCDVGMVMIGGKRDYILYCADGQKLLGQLFIELSEFGPHLETVHDPSWSQYRDLVNLS